MWSSDPRILIQYKVCIQNKHEQLNDETLGQVPVSRLDAQDYQSRPGHQNNVNAGTSILKKKKR